MLGRDCMHSCPASKRKGLRLMFAPPECTGAERSESYTIRGFSAPIWHSYQTKGSTRCKVWDFVCYKGSGLGNGQMEVKHLSLFTASQSGLTQRRSHFWEGENEISPLLKDSKQEWLKNPLQGAYVQEEDRKRNA